MIEAVAGARHAPAIAEPEPDRSLEETHPQSCERYKDSGGAASGRARRADTQTKA